MDVARGELNVTESTDENVSSRPMHVLSAKPAKKPGSCRCGKAATVLNSPCRRYKLRNT